MNFRRSRIELIYHPYIWWFFFSKIDICRYEKNMSEWSLRKVKKKRFFSLASRYSQQIANFRFYDFFQSTPPILCIYVCIHNCICTVDCLLSLAASYGIFMRDHRRTSALSLLDSFCSQTINIFHLFAYLKCVSDIFAFRQCTSMSLLLLPLRPLVRCVSNSIFISINIFIFSHVCFVGFIIVDTFCANSPYGPQFSGSIYIYKIHVSVWFLLYCGVFCFMWGFFSVFRYPKHEHIFYRLRCKWVCPLWFVTFLHWNVTKVCAFLCIIICFFRIKPQIKVFIFRSSPILRWVSENFYQTTRHLLTSRIFFTVPQCFSAFSFIYYFSSLTLFS